MRNSRDELLQFLITHNIRVACLQETKLTPPSNPVLFKGYSVVRRDRPSGDGGGGLAFLVREDTPYLPLDTDPLFPNDPTTEHQGIYATIDNIKLAIINLYIPPANSCPRDHSPQLSHLFERDFGCDTLVVGDFNAHHEAWHSSTNSSRAAARGELIVEAAESSSLCLLNTAHPTRLPTNGPASSPDLSFCSAHLALTALWQPATRLNSDHLPILINLHDTDSAPSGLPPTLYSNYKKADWSGFEEYVESRLALMPEPGSCAQGEKILRAILQEASKIYIPRGRVPNFIPNLSQEALSLIATRDQIRDDDRTSPEITALNSQIQEELDSARRTTWERYITQANPNDPSNLFWTILGQLTGKKTRPPANLPITFGNKTLTTKRDIADAFCRLFTGHAPPRDRHQRQLKRQIRKRTLDRDFKPFTPQLVLNAIKKSGTSTAPGPDNLNILHLRHLGPTAIAYLCLLFNLSLAHANLPAIWRQAIIIAIPKPGKPNTQGTSYRPISLLSPTVKVLERLVLPYLQAGFTFAESQHGFRQARSTTTALLPITESIARGFNEPKPPTRTTILAIDFSKAFDTVPHHRLLHRILQSNLHNNLIRWVAAFLGGRQACCQYQSARSRYRGARVGVPQGSVISPVLFNYFVSDHPNTADLHSSYADDFTAAAASPNVPETAERLTNHAADVATWAEERGLTISLPKSHVTLFTSDSHQSRLEPAVSLGGVRLPPCRNPKVLGVTLDPHLTFAAHAKELLARSRAKLNIMRAMTGVGWGQSKETLLITYKALVKPLLTYAAPVWYPLVSPSSIKPLQSVQNAAIRIATGTVVMSSQDHLHSEAEMLPVGRELTMLCEQFLLGALRPGHPSNAVVSSDPGPRRPLVRQTLRSKFLPAVEPFLQDGATPEDSYRQALAEIHRRSVAGAIAAQDPNRVLDRRPPPVAAEEKNLPRRFRTTLAQLRSGFSSAMGDYLHRIGRAPSPLCPECGISDHSVPHLFACPARPTDLRPADLWE